VAVAGAELAVAVDNCESPSSISLTALRLFMAKDLGRVDLSGSLPWRNAAEWEDVSV
jgi:hypothetical protein